MDNVNKTLYIPLYGKAYVSRKGIILRDQKAEEIWDKEGFPLKGKSRSKWLAYYMGMRSAVFDQWLRDQIAGMSDPVVLHIGCGMDSRILRVETNHVSSWYDVDFPDVIKERRKYYAENDSYHMVSADVRDGNWIVNIPKAENAVAVMEGVSMYILPDELKKLLQVISGHFQNVCLLMDCYSVFAAKLSKIRNPINDVGGATVYGVDAPQLLADSTGFSFSKEHDMTPPSLIEELHGMERVIFRAVYAGRVSKKMYRIYAFTSN